jgi:hypothetical protein
MRAKKGSASCIRSVPSAKKDGSVTAEDNTARLMEFLYGWLL